MSVQQLLYYCAQHSVGYRRHCDCHSDLHSNLHSDCQSSSHSDNYSNHHSDRHYDRHSNHHSDYSHPVYQQSVLCLVFSMRIRMSLLTVCFCIITGRLKLGSIDLYMYMYLTGNYFSSLTTPNCAHTSSV